MATRSDKKAFMALIELVRSPSARNARVVVEYDWSRLPQVWRRGFAEMDPLDYVGVAEASQAFLKEACADVDSRDGSSPDLLHPLEIFAMHVLDPGATWDSIQAYRQEQGLPQVSARTLRNRQDEAVRYLLEWAQRPEPSSETPDVAQGSDDVVPGPNQGSAPTNAASEGVSRRNIMVVLLLLALTTIAVLALRNQDEDSTPRVEMNPSMGVAERLRSIRSEFVGIHMEPMVPFGSPVYTPHINDILPGLTLPPLGSPVQSAILVPLGSENRLGLILGTARGGENPGRLLLWDPIDDEILWDISYQPDPEKVMTHEGLEESTPSESYGVRFLAYGSGDWNLGDRFAAFYQQRMSPTFVIFVELSSGRITAEYAHPGHLYCRSVYDLDGDGEVELLLGGSENSQDKAVLVALDPLMEDGAASTVIWNQNQREGAIFRVLFPRFPVWEEFSGQPRMDAYGIDRNSWFPKSRTLVVSVGYLGIREKQAYYAYLRNGFDVIPDKTIVLGDEEARLWQMLGLDVSSTKRELEEGITVVWGRGFDRRTADDY